MHIQILSSATVILYKIARCGIKMDFHGLSNGIRPSIRLDRLAPFYRYYKGPIMSRLRI